MEMPGRKYSSEAYRYDYQGQFAEKDGETGLHSFELRQWDARIARWISTDPYGQYFSPYMGMGNSPVMSVDPDGGCTNCPENANIGDVFSHSELGELSFTEGGWIDANGGFVMDDIDLTYSPFGSSMNDPTFSNLFNSGSITQYTPNAFGEFQESAMGQTIVGRALYGVADGVHVYGTALIYGHGKASHLNNSLAVGSDLQDAGINTLTSFVPISRIGGFLGIGPKTLNAGQFNSLYKGTGVTAASNGGLNIKVSNNIIRIHNDFKKTYSGFGHGVNILGGTQK